MLASVSPQVCNSVRATTSPAFGVQAAGSSCWALSCCASTNPLERLNKEIKRRSDVVGIFPNDEAIQRLVGAVVLEQSEEWQVGCCYMAKHSLVSFNKNSSNF